jgi:hypothetical protein
MVSNPPIGPFASYLSEEQQTEIWSLIISLREHHATLDEMRTAIQHKLHELSNDIGFHHGPCGGSDVFLPPEESDQ